MHETGSNNQISHGSNVRLAGRINGNHNTISIGNSKHESVINLYINGNYNNILIGDIFQIRALSIHCGNHVLAHNIKLSIGNNRLYQKAV